ncbi:MAG: hypothetical protein A2445_03875 [Candidatus Jacksonbacteria bacterium RIFOXYC2_FULL_44_29]|nr:MAG: hypothetical protein UV19_C0001G0078 [Parcubacteria group bacterium GW2011_GWA2_42_28]OGY78806.1 MAG: hypothetical protein A2550_04660 [Candidatus Jacksonbacteria bacterium RIFOXYD2_FULL_43_21]OGY80146.1 MAG: hypothetical protein A2445_03875 [Candidatus Jacksonbacteria bacterium RIFOXYC2_FULL_44_29]HCC50340.1 hypothetical protein [Candidatus Jacksonbacteria bacterium]HCR15694.1 hypothetical protein [Candidatus Jacksonbacteria bacterium]
MNNEFKINPFPDIARFPESETALGAEIAAEPQPEGPPQNPEESAFWILPEVGRAVELIERYEKMNSEGRGNIVRELAKKLANDPKQWENFNDALNIVREQNELSPDRISELQSKIDARLEKNPEFEPFPPSVQVLEHWLSLIGESALYGPAGEKMLKKMVEKCTNPKIITELLYNLALGGLTSSNESVNEKTLEILCLNTGILTPDSPQASKYLLAFFDSDDAVLKPAMELDHAIEFIGKLKNPQSVENRHETLSSIYRNPGFASQFDKIKNDDPARMEAIVRMYSRSTDEFNLATVSDPNAFPYNLAMRSPGPLREWCNERVAEEVSRRDGTIALNLHLPNVEGTINFDSLEEASEHIRRKLQEPNSNNSAIEGKLFWQTLARLSPSALTPEQITDFTELNRELSDNIKNDPKYLLSPRGDSVEIINNALNRLGFKKIQFNMNPHNRRDTIVSLTIGNFTYQINLDEFMSLRDTFDDASVTLPQSGAFLNNVILSHLHAIRCRETAVEAYQTVTEQIEPTAGRNPLTARRAHLRTLPTGQNPTPEQIEFARKDADIDLIRVNAERAARGITTKKTYVRAFVSDNLEGSTPLESRATAAVTTRLDQILASSRPGETSAIIPEI